MGLYAIINRTACGSREVGNVTDIGYQKAPHKNDLFRVEIKFRKNTRIIGLLRRCATVSPLAATTIANFAKDNPEHPAIQAAIKDAIQQVVPVFITFCNQYKLALRTAQVLEMPSSKGLANQIAQAVRNTLLIENSTLRLTKFTIGEFLQRNVTKPEDFNRIFNFVSAKNLPLTTAFSRNRHIPLDLKPTYRKAQFLRKSGQSDFLQLLCDDDLRTRYSFNCARELDANIRFLFVLFYNPYPTPPPLNAQQQRVYEKLIQLKKQHKCQPYPRLTNARGATPKGLISMRELARKFTIDMPTEELHKLLCNTLV